MDHRLSFANELSALESLLARIAEVTARTDDARRGELVALRRNLSSQIASIGRAGDALFAGREDLAAYRAKFSCMRSAAALHQADWPAVLLGERPGEFRASADRMREANRDFIAWAREALSRA
jgi:hypothetical protein